MEEGTRWAGISKALKCRNENSVKNRYLSLMGLHSISRQKIKKFSEEMKESVKKKIDEIRTEINKKNFQKMQKDLENQQMCYYWFYNMLFVMNMQSLSTIAPFISPNNL